MDGFWGGFPALEKQDFVHRVAQKLVNSSPTPHPVGTSGCLPCSRPLATPELERTWPKTYLWLSGTNPWKLQKPPKPARNPCTDLLQRSGACVEDVAMLTYFPKTLLDVLHLGGFSLPSHTMLLRKELPHNYLSFWTRDFGKEALLQGITSEIHSLCKNTYVRCFLFYMSSVFVRGY